MEVKQGDKTLFHIQSLEITTDGDSAFDMFVWAVNTPIRDEIIRLLEQEFDNSAMDYEAMADTCEVYKVYAEEL